MRRRWRRRRLPRRGVPHPLQAAQVCRDSTCRARHGQVDELERRLEHDAGQQWERRRHPASCRDADGMKVDWARSSATSTHARSAFPSSSAIVSKPISASWLIRRYAAKITAAMSTMSRARMRRSGVISGAVLPVVAAAEARRSLSATSCARARSRRCGVSAAGCRYGRTRATASPQPARTALLNARLRADEHRAGDEELGDVDVELRLVRSERRRRQVDEHRPVVADEHVARVEPAMRNAGRVEPRDLSPESSSSSSLTWSALESSSGSTSGWRVDHERVVLGAKHHGDDLGDPNTGLRSHQRRHGFVLDLLQSPDRCASRWVTVGEKAPATSQPLGVLRVPAEHPHLQRAPVRVVADKQRRADSLPLRDASSPASRRRAQPARRARAGCAARLRPIRTRAERWHLPRDRVRGRPAARDGEAASSATVPTAADEHEPMCNACARVG